MNDDRQLACWRAIEALRAGVPNRDAVRELGCSQPVIENRFFELMNAMRRTPRRNLHMKGPSLQVVLEQVSHTYWSTSITWLWQTTLSAAGW